MRVRNANKLSIVFECDIMSLAFFFPADTQGKDRQCVVAISSFKKKREDALFSLSVFHLSLSRDLFEIIIRPEVFYKCMGNDEVALPRALNIYLLNPRVGGIF